MERSKQPLIRCLSVMTRPASVVERENLRETDQGRGVRDGPGVKMTARTAHLVADVLRQRRLRLAHQPPAVDQLRRIEPRQQVGEARRHEARRRCRFRRRCRAQGGDRVGGDRSANIMPDRKTGIGGWSLAEFEGALRTVERLHVVVGDFCERSVRHRGIEKAAIRSDAAAGRVDDSHRRGEASPTVIGLPPSALWQAAQSPIRTR